MSQGELKTFLETYPDQLAFLPTTYIPSKGSFNWPVYEDRPNQQPITPYCDWIEKSWVSIMAQHFSMIEAIPELWSPNNSAIQLDPCPVLIKHVKTYPSGIMRYENKLAVTSPPYVFVDGQRVTVVHHDHASTAREELPSLVGSGLPLYVSLIRWLNPSKISIEARKALSKIEP